MRLPNSFADQAIFLVADTSVVISLNATGDASRILRALPLHVVVTDVVAGELEEGRRTGRRDAELLATLVDEQLVNVATLGEVGKRVFAELVIGPATETLDDGEAATIAYAVEYGCVPIIDERKANRICAQRFPHVRPASTVDLLVHPSVGAALSHKDLGDAAFRALQQARMRVLSHHVDGIVRLIGIERAKLCPSLPKSARLPKSG